MKEAWLGKTIANSVEVIIYTPALCMNLNSTPPSFPFRRSNFLRRVSLHTQPSLASVHPTTFHPMLSLSRHPPPLIYIDII